MRTRIGLHRAVCGGAQRIIENYLELKEKLQREGHKFVTETDTEIVAHMVEKYAKELPFEEAVRKTLKDLRGIYSLVFLSAKDPQKLIAARIGPPSVIGLGDGEFFVASDIPALLEHTRKIFFLADGDVAVLTRDGVRVTDLDGKPVDRPAHRLPGTRSWQKRAATSISCRRRFRTATGGARYVAGADFAGYRQGVSGRNGDYGKGISGIPECADCGLRNELARGVGWEIHD